MDYIKKVKNRYMNLEASDRPKNIDKNKKLRELNDINYFSQPAAEKVNTSWYMKKKK